jgi:hypothetical protein
MSFLIGSNSTYSGQSVLTADIQDGTTTDAPASPSGVHIAKADGLRGDLGLYEVTTKGATQFMTWEEAVKTAADSDPAPEDGAPDFSAKAQAATAPRGGLFTWFLEIYIKQLGEELNDAANKAG